MTSTYDSWLSAQASAAAEGPAGAVPGVPVITVPFTPEQVASLNGYQAIGAMHEFTCASSEDCPPLIADSDGWHCTVCDYIQNWAYAWMADWSWHERPRLSRYSS